MARIRYLCVHTNLTSVVDPEGYKTYSGSGSNYEFLEFPILPILFKHIEKLLKMNISISIKKKNLSTICDFIFQTTVRYVPVLQSYSTVYQQPESSGLKHTDQFLNSSALSFCLDPDSEQ